MNSYNQYAYGAVAAWMYRYAARIDALSADHGFHTIYLHPNFDARLDSLASLPNPPTEQFARTGRSKGPTAIWNITIPPNAIVAFPVDATKASAFMLDGTPIAQSVRVLAEGSHSYRFPSGNYSVKVSLEGKFNTPNINGSF